MNATPTRPDWTGGPAKWAAVAVLGVASIGGMAWSIFGREPRARAMTMHQPAPLVAGAPNVATEAGAEGPTVAGAPALLPPAPARATATVARLINLNTASGPELELLPGIGPALAARILEYRRQHGRFRSIEELDNVKGIGPRTLEKLRPLVTIE